MQSSDEISFEEKNQITKAIEAAGNNPMVVAKICGLTSYQAVRKWEKKGSLPRTEWTGETNYSEKIYYALGVVVPPYNPELTQQSA